jgi:hypothetical protein
MLNVILRSYGCLLVVGLAACAGGSHDGLGGSGGTGGATSATQGHATATSTTTNQSSTATGLDAQLLDGCTMDCMKVDALSTQLGCAPTPNCVGDCVDYGKFVGACEDEYVALNACVYDQISANTCYCGTSNGGILACNLCPSQLGAFQQCMGDGF